ncbi:hypothetical protein [Phytohabitans kaempferiae]|uniref:CcmD family protein n=1 Tax=Phytohabitans kaempferiae TaxID=1620943 RepID=A0ABV6MB60_9ACTN
MTQTGGFAFLIAWGTFFLLCGFLVYLILRRRESGGRPRRGRALFRRRGRSRR